MSLGAAALYDRGMRRHWRDPAFTVSNGTIYSPVWMCSPLGFDGGAVSALPAGSADVHTVNGPEIEWTLQATTASGTSNLITLQASHDLAFTNSIKFLEIAAPAVGLYSSSIGHTTISGFGGIHFQMPQTRAPLPFWRLALTNVGGTFAGEVAVIGGAF